MSAPSRSGPATPRAERHPWWVYAAPREGQPWADDPDALALGVGKVAATLTLTRALAALAGGAPAARGAHHGRRDQAGPGAVVLFGVAGAYPGGPAVGEVCLVVEDWLADEGVEVADGFLSLEQLGLGRRGPWRADEALTDALQRALGEPVPRVRGATVSTCSGTDARSAARVAACPGVAVESMEGAAVGAVCAQFGLPWAQVRVISNRTGDRERAGWALDPALDRLHEVVGRLRGHFSPG